MPAVDARFLEQHASELIDQAREAKGSLLITRNGKPAAYLVDAGTWEAQTERLAILKGLIEGERAIAEGAIVTQEEAERRLASWRR